MSKEIKKKSIFDRLDTTVVLAFLVWAVIPPDSTNQALIVSSMILKFYCTIGFAGIGVVMLCSVFKFIGVVKKSPETYLRLSAISDMLSFTAIAIVYIMASLAVSEVVSFKVGLIVCAFPTALVLIGLVLRLISVSLAKKAQGENHSN